MVRGDEEASDIAVALTERGSVDKDLARREIQVVEVASCRASAPGAEPAQLQRMFIHLC